MKPTLSGKPAIDPLTSAIASLHREPSGNTIEERETKIHRRNLQ